MTRRLDLETALAHSRLHSAEFLSAPDSKILRINWGTLVQMAFRRQMWVYMPINLGGSLGAVTNSACFKPVSWSPFAPGA